ncbi:MAG TPA: tetratricopeptide repeat protein [Candidatus Kapabacteria bacterium]|nr:tetratricopeptide repeat protein [Candidatus Kapabacteria bacterium]
MAFSFHTRLLPSRARLRSLLLLLLLGLAASVRASAQEGATSDSLRHAQDSIVTEAWRALELDSTKVDEYEKIIAIYKSRKRYAEELQLANTMLAAVPAAASSYLAVGDAQLDNGAPELAIAPLMKALIIEPAFVRVRTTLAEAYTMMRQFDSALFQLDTAIRLNPRFAQAHAQRATLLTQLGRDSLAVESYRTTAELLPDSFTPWLKLARALEHVEHNTEALETAEYAMSLNRDSPDALYLVGELNQKLGHREAAASAFENFMLRFPTERRALEAERIARELRGKEQ